MRFGSMIFSISPERERDHEIIHSTLQDAVRAEEIGLDAVWLTEHHFDGTVAYADPLVFAGAVAARTSRVKIGFAVVEMALHHPVRLAVQTSLIDHLSRGRLIVGTGRGSIFNEYEYIGFGVTMEQGRDMIPEAEELLIKAWTGEDIDHQGRYWKSAFPMLRPQPYQRPHPPLVRACATEGSLKQMAGIGRPVLIGVQTIDTLRQRFQMYRDSMLEAGFGEEAVEEALDQTWAQRGLYVGESDEEAQEVAEAALSKSTHHLLEARIKYNPGGETHVPAGQPPRAAEIPEVAFLAGTPSTVAEQIAELKEAGVRNLLMNMNVGQMDRKHVESSMRAFGEKVLPAVRGL